GGAGRPGPAGGWGSRAMLVGAPLEARVQVRVEAPEVVDRLVELGACHRPGRARRRPAAEPARHDQHEEVLPGWGRAPARERGDLVPAAVGALGPAEEPVPSRVLLRAAGRTDRR